MMLGEQELPMRGIFYCIFLWWLLCLPKYLFSDLKRKLDIVKRKKLVANNMLFLHERFFAAHNHEHDANGNHEDHTEGTAHTVYHQLKSSWIPY
jgi:hypothetical protein